MATVNSDTGSGLEHPVRNWVDGATWVGGSAPLAADTAYVQGITRTLINYAAGYAKWVGTTTITVDSTTGFPAAPSYFYTNTTLGEWLKVNYTGLTGTTFTGCSLDESDVNYKWVDGGTIADNYYVHAPAPIVQINAGETVEIELLYIRYGGTVQINPGGTLKVNNGLFVQDGRLVGTGNGTIRLTRPSASDLSGSYIGGITAENYGLQWINIDGGEVRANGTAEVLDIGDVYAPVAMTSGSLETEDIVAIYDPDNTRVMSSGFFRLEAGTVNVNGDYEKLTDEGLKVVGTDASGVFLGPMTGVEAPILSVISSGNPCQIIVDSNSFQVGDKVVINNAAYTVTTAEDSTFPLATYDFVASSDLTDFLTNSTDDTDYTDWSFDAYGIKNARAAYVHLINKKYFRQHFVLEAWMSPRANWTSGTRDGDDFGLIWDFEPSLRRHVGGWSSSRASYLRVDDTGNNISLYQRNVSTQRANKISWDTQGLQAAERTAALYKIEKRKGLVKISINGVELCEDYQRNGNYAGLLGIVVDSNAQFHCSWLRISAASQTLTLDGTANFVPGDIVREAGVERSHYADQKIVKISSTITNPGTHYDYAYGLRGVDGSYVWPMMRGFNSNLNTNANAAYLLNHDMNYDYYYDAGAGSNKYVTIDLQEEVTFTHIGFQQRNSDMSNGCSLLQVKIYGSNDGSTWSTLYGPTDDTRKWHTNYPSILAFYPTGTVSYRYIKFETGGNTTQNYNRYVNFSVYNFTDGYTLQLSNVSDLNIGDTITVLIKGAFGAERDDSAEYTAMYTNGADPDTYYWGHYHHAVITNIVGNTIYLDRPIYWGAPEAGQSVVRLNKNFTITGAIAQGTGGWMKPNITIADGTATPRRNWFRNCQMHYIGSYRYTASSDNNRGFRTYADNANPTIFDGVSMWKNKCSGGTTCGWGSVNGSSIVRTSHISGLRSMYVYYDKYPLPNYWVTSTLHHVHNFYIVGTRNYAIAYSQITAAGYGLNLSDCGPSYVTGRAPIFKRNILNGLSDGGFNIGPGCPQMTIDASHNLITDSDDYLFVSYGPQPLDMNQMMTGKLLHTGDRLNRYNNSGSFNHAKGLLEVALLKDYNRFGYDLGVGIAGTVYRKEPNWDFIRAYPYTLDIAVPLLGMSYDARTNHQHQVNLQFEYRYSRINKIMDDPIGDGKFRVTAVQHGNAVEISNGPVPTTLGDGWYSYSHTFTGMAAEKGNVGIYLMFPSYFGYLDIRNTRATILSAEPSNIWVQTNNFDLGMLFDAGQYKQYLRSSSPYRTAEFKKVKF